MEHRHIQTGDVLSAAAIDDIIDRGGRADWAFLRDQSRGDALVMEKIRRVCEAHCSDPFDQKYHRNSLALAAENGCTSIAFPCISTGIYGYPKEAAAQIAVREVENFLAQSRRDAEMVGRRDPTPPKGRARSPSARGEDGRARSPSAPQDRGGGRSATA